MSKTHINWPALLVFLGLLALWQLFSSCGVFPAYMVPTPVRVGEAFIKDLPMLVPHTLTTLIEALLGLVIGIAVGSVLAIVMDEVAIIKRAFSPLLTVSQTIPTVAIAPLLVLWLGYAMLPKIVLVALTTFFPISISLLSGFDSVKPEQIDLMKTLGASRVQILTWVKLPAAREAFFSGLRMSVTYAVVGAVIAEWLGGMQGLGVAMERMRKSFAYADMFAVIIVISLLSIALMEAVRLIEYVTSPWKHKRKGV